MVNNTLAKINSKAVWWFVAAGIYSVVFLITRLTNIHTFPLYIDEITHIYVAKLTVNGNFFIGLSETAKQTYVWLVAIALYLVADPIFAGRVVSVVAGLVTAAICYALTNRLYPRRNAGYLAALFYLVSPFAVMFDRMALADGLLATLMGACVLAGVQLWRTSSMKWAVILGILFGLAVLNKAYAVFYYPVPLLLWLFLGKTIRWAKIAKLLVVTYGTAFGAWVLIWISDMSRQARGANRYCSRPSGLARQTNE